MRRPLVRTCSVLALTSLPGLTACGNDDPAGAEEVLMRVQSESYRTWERAPGYEMRRDSTAPHGGNVEIFVNDVLITALESSTAPSEWPQGSVVVKDGFRDSGDLAQISIMERATGWYYAEYDSAGNPSYSGTPGICTGCHSQGDDFIRAFPFPGG